MSLYATCCGVGYLVSSVVLGVTLVFLFVTLVSAISEVVEHYMDGGDAGVVASAPRAG